jgi:hypothetical protein
VDFNQTPEVHVAKSSKILTSEQIDSFVEALKATVAAAETGIRLREMVASLDGSPPSRPAPAPKAIAAPKSAPVAKARRTRTPGLDPSKVLEGLKGAKDGMSLGAVAAKVGEKKKDRVAAALRKLRDEKKAIVKGTRRDAKWFAN